MSKILKLTGISSYISAATRGVNVMKGMVCRFPEDVANQVLDYSRPDKEGAEIPYFTEAPAGAKIDHDFTTPVAVLDDGRDTVRTAVKQSPSRQRRPAKTEEAESV